MIRAKTAPIRYRTLAVGITGGIGSGKTEACHVFESSGARVYSADLMARELIDTDERIKDKIRRVFPNGAYANGRLDRKRMAQLVFHDDSLQEKLNAIVHPFVLRRMEELIREVKGKKSEPMIVIEAALIFESGADRFLDFIIAVEAAVDRRMERVRSRDGASGSETLRRIRAQLPPLTVGRKADFVIRNDGDLASFRQRCLFLYSLLETIARRSS